MKRAIYAGTFDPLTNGHMDVVERALTIFDEVTMLVASSSKKTIFTAEERVEMIEEVFSHKKNIKAVSWSGLLVDFARNENINFLVRGLRPTGDFESEFQMACMNSELNADLETVFFMSATNKHYISSSLIKEVCLHNGDISKFVPKLVLENLEKRFHE